MNVVNEFCYEDCPVFSCGMPYICSMKLAAQAISVVFHPLFMVTYMAILLSFINPYLFGVKHPSENVLFIIQVFVSTFFLPAMTTFLMMAMGFVESLEMEDHKERIGPLIATCVFYMWLWFNFYNYEKTPTAFNVFLLGATIALVLAFVINVFSKISLHALGVGGLLGMVVITMLHFSYGSFLVYGYSIQMAHLLMAVIFISGLVGTARLYLEAHEPMDLYGGFFIGLGTQFLALAFLT